jgi:hypothetical protein
MGRGGGSLLYERWNWPDAPRTKPPHLLLCCVFHEKAVNIYPQKFIFAMSSSGVVGREGSCP